VPSSGTLRIGAVTPDGPNDITSDPNTIKQLLFDYHSSLGQHNSDDPRFDKAFCQRIETELSSVSPTEIGPAFCEQDMSTEEIKAALNKLENNKAAGMDCVQNEALKYGGDSLLESLQTLFNFILKTGVSPTIWQSAMIHLIFKDGGLDPLEAASYRPISLTLCISKVYERVILNRLSEAFERDGILPEEQVGFRQHRCTLEQAYILREAVDSRKHRHATFMCFVDFTNAFPSTWQDGMWSRLRETGVKGRLYRSIRSLYKLCKSSIQTPYGLTDWFMSDLGTRQGAVLYPLLFSLVVNPLATLLKSKGFGVKMGGIQLACLLYADDLVLIADSEEHLQEMMNTTTEFLQQWRFVVSARKIQVVAFGRGETRSLKDRVWQIGNETVHDVRSYKYLGLIFEKGGLWNKMQDKNLDKAKAGYKRLYQVGFGDSGLQVGHFAFLWDLFTKPKMLYGAEVWTCNSETALLDLEKFQIQGARKVFGKRAMSTVIGEAALGDLGWMSVRSQILEIKMRFYGYLCRLPETRLAKQVFLLRKLEYTNPNGLPNLTLPDKTKSWFHDIQTGLERVLKLVPIYANTQIVGAHSKSQWNKLVHEKILEFDKNQLFQSCPAQTRGNFTAISKPNMVERRIFWRMIDARQCLSSICARDLLVFEPACSMVFSSR
jgi:hypothetical protein